MARFPELNAHWIGGRLVPLDAIHIGVAVALDQNLITVSMKDVGGAGLEEMQARFKALIRKAAQMHLGHADLYGSSLTITNLGEYEITGFTAVLNPPEIFILAIGMLRERVVPRDGGFAAVPYSTFCLSFDHRGVDGAPASRLLREIKHILEGYGEA
jgi:pyruvate dehydrogenase E2 component (dihydrolipoamide acetyltransferase)